MPGKRTLVNTLTDSILTSVKVSNIDQYEPENSICENTILASKIAERVIARLAGTNSPPSTQKPELLPYDINCYENEESEHRHYANPTELWESDPYLAPHSDVKKTYNKVMSRFVYNERNRPYEIKNYNITDEKDHYIWYTKINNKRVEANFKITITELETLLKEKATLPSRYSIYNFLQRYYCQLYAGQDAYSQIDIMAIYSHYELRPPHDSLPVIWGLYYDIVNHFAAAFLGERAGSDDGEYQKLVTRFIFMLTQFKKLKDEYPGNTFPEKVDKYRQEYYNREDLFDRSDDDSDDDDSGGRYEDGEKLKEEAETLKNKYAEELNEIVNSTEISVNKLRNSREQGTAKKEIVSMYETELERLKKCQETLKNNPLSVEILNNDLEYLKKTEHFDEAAALEDYIDVIARLAAIHADA